MKRHAWIRGKVTDHGNGGRYPYPKHWLYKCHTCGRTLDRSDMKSYFPTLQELLDKGINEDCSVEVVKAVMSS